MLTRIRPLSCGFDSSVGRALHWHRRGRGFESRSEPEFFSGLCSSSVTAALALMTVSTQLLLMDKINFQHFEFCIGLRRFKTSFWFTAILNLYFSYCNMQSRKRWINRTSSKCTPHIIGKVLIVAHSTERRTTFSISTCKASMFKSFSSVTSFSVVMLLFFSELL